MDGDKLLRVISGGGVALIVLLALFYGRGTEVNSANETVAALEARIAGVETAVTEAEEASAEQAAASDARMSELEAAVAQASDDAAQAAESAQSGIAALQSQMDEAGAATTAAMAEMEDRVSASVAAAAAAAAAGAAAATAASATTAEATTDSAAAPAAAAKEERIPGEPGFMPGQTASLGDGALKVFVSRLMPAEGQARLSIGGAMGTYDAGSATLVRVGKDHCELSVDAVSSDGALMSALCGDALADPEGIAAGETALLNDGALRVFASRVTDDGARLSVNGKLSDLTVGRSVAAMAGEDRCRVQLDGVGRGHAQVSSVCGAEIKVSDPIGPGATALLGEGKARVFLSAVDTDAQQVRFAVNGQATHMGGSGFEVAVEDACFVTVEDVIAGAASFSYSCAEE